MSPRRETPRSGYTLVEVAVVLALVGGLLWSLHRSSSAITGAYKTGTASMGLDTRGARLAQRLGTVLRATAFDTVATVPEPPFSATSLRFAVMEPHDGVLSSLGPPQEIRLDATTGTVALTRSPGLANEVEAGLASGVAGLLEGETLNGLDDNGNGLIDEAGFAVCRSGGVIDVYFTLVGEIRGQATARTWHVRTTCRN